MANYWQVQKTEILKQPKINNVVLRFKLRANITM